MTHQLQQHHQQQQQQEPQQQQQQQAQQLQAAGPAAAITLCFYQNPEGTSSPGTAFFGGRSVLQGHGVLLFRMGRDSMFLEVVPSFSAPESWQ